MIYTKKSLAKQMVLDFAKPNVPFSTKQVVDKVTAKSCFVNPQMVQLALRQLVEEKWLVRVVHGVYVKPKGTT